MVSGEAETGAFIITGESGTPLLRVRPATTATQRCDISRADRSGDAAGTPCRLLRHRGDRFGISKPHSSLTIDVRARVVTSEPPEPPDPVWEAVAAASYLQAAGEYLLPSVVEPPNGALDELFAMTTSPPR